MNTLRLIKLTTVVAALVFFASISIFIDKAKEGLALELAASQDRIEMFIAANKANSYMQKGIFPAEEQPKVLNEILEASNKQNNVNPDFKNYIELVKADLAANKLPDETLTNKWLGAFVFQVAFDEVKSRSRSEENTAPANMITHSKWSSWIYIILSSGLLSMFWMGYLVGQNRQTKKK